MRHLRILCRTTTGAALAIAVVLALTCSAVAASAGELAAGRPATGAELAAFAPQQDKLPVPPPAGAIVLFDGRSTNLFLSREGKAIDWPVENGVLVSTRGQGRTNHIVSQLHFRDADIHVEFLLPEKSPGNSGVYLHGNYELQIFNSFGKQDPTMDDIGAIYGFAKPLANACRPPGQWQVYDIRYRAPRRDPATGTIVQDGALTAFLNGVRVQDRTAFGAPRSHYHPFRYGTTPYLAKIWERQQRTGVGPVFLQDHDSPVRFRNVWVRPLDREAFLYEPDRARPVVVCFGDSITFSGYPKHLERLLPVRVVNAGVGGNTTRDALRRLDKDVLAQRPAAVVLFFGANDSRQDAPGHQVPLDEYEANLGKLIDGCRKSGAKVVLGTMPPINPGPYYQRHRKEKYEPLGGLEAIVARYREAALRVGTAKDVPVLDLHRLLTDRPEWMSPDGVHPSPRGQTIIAELVANALRSVLGIEPPAAAAK